MKLDELKALVQSLLDAKLAGAADAINAEYKPIVDGLAALEVEPSADPEVAELQAQLADATNALTAANGKINELQAQVDAAAAKAIETAGEVAKAKEDLAKVAADLEDASN